MLLFFAKCQYRLQILIINIISSNSTILRKSLKYCLELIIDLSLSFLTLPARHCPWTKWWIAWQPPFWNKQTYCSVLVFSIFHAIFMVSQFMKVADLCQIYHKSATISQFLSFSSRIRLIKQYLFRMVIKMLERQIFSLEICIVAQKIQMSNCFH